jgi:uncharacterized protein (TIGR02271 family)
MTYETNNASGAGTTTQVVVGLFNDAQDAHQAITQLRAAGFTSKQIGAAFRTHSRDEYATHSNAVSAKTTSHDGENWWEKVKEAFHSDDTAGQRRDEAAGFTSGKDAAVADHEYDFPAEDFESSLAATGIPSDRASYLSRSLRPGGAIVTVTDPARAAEAEQLLAANNGRVRYENISDPAMSDNDGRDRYDAQNPAVLTGRTVADTREDGRLPQESATGISANENPANEDWQRRSDDPSAVSGERVQLFGEVLRVHKERINRGEVRVHKDVVTEHQTIEVPVTREELVLERVAVSGNTPATSADIGGGQEIRVPLSEDRVRVEKEAVVREEVTVGKREVAATQTVSDDVRHEELRVDSDDVPKRAASGEELPADVRRRG